MFRGKIGKFNKATGKVEWWDLSEPSPPKEVNAPYVHSDEIQPTMSHATSEGLMFESKSKLRAHYKQHGYEERGCAPEYKLPERPKPDREQIRRDVEKSYYDIKYDRVPISERERQVCREEQRKLGKNYTVKNLEQLLK